MKTRFFLLFLVGFIKSLKPQYDSNIYEYLIQDQNDLFTVPDIDCLSKVKSNNPFDEEDFDEEDFDFKLPYLKPYKGAVLIQVIFKKDLAEVNEWAFLKINQYNQDFLKYMEYLRTVYGPSEEVKEIFYQMIKRELNIVLSSNKFQNDEIFLFYLDLIHDEYKGVLHFEVREPNENGLGVKKNLFLDDRNKNNQEYLRYLEYLRYFYMDHLSADEEIKRFCKLMELNVMAVTLTQNQNFPLGTKIDITF